MARIEKVTGKMGGKAERGKNKDRQERNNIENEIRN